ncbi:unnamed protein product [Toxocara canis]|uniref:NPL domain-containing protein n=1 Tax=Toxocara canis TaxID=6265 RepID=A0A183UP40_TOXCA|nr:unnamed protein product [Toxocara canis]
MSLCRLRYISGKCFVVQKAPVALEKSANKLALVFVRQAVHPDRSSSTSQMGIVVVSPAHGPGRQVQIQYSGVGMYQPVMLNSFVVISDFEQPLGDLVKTFGLCTQKCKIFSAGDECKIEVIVSGRWLICAL